VGPYGVGEAMGKPLSFLASDGTRMSCPAYLRNNSSSSESKGDGRDGRTTTALRFALVLPLPGQKSLQESSVSSAALFLLLCRALQQ